MGSDYKHVRIIYIIEGVSMLTRVVPARLALFGASHKFTSVLPSLCACHIFLSDQFLA